MVSSATLRSFSSSATTDTSGIMISGFGFKPSFCSWAQAVAMARTCITGRMGYTMPRRQPRRPSIGFASLMPSICSMSMRFSAMSASTARTPALLM